MSKEIKGYFITFAPVEIDLLFTAMDEEGYTKDIEGIKKLLIDWATEEPESKQDNVVGIVENFIVQNPEKIQAGLKIASSFLSKTFKKK